MFWFVFFRTQFGLLVLFKTLFGTDNPCPHCTSSQVVSSQVETGVVVEVGEKTTGTIRREPAEISP
jgi:hypothetical protein